MILLPKTHNGGVTASLRTGLDELARTIDRRLPEGESRRRVGPVWISREPGPTPLAAGLYVPMLCVVAQGAKRLLLGDRDHRYDPGRFLLNSVAVPASGGVAEASPARPCLWTMIELDPALVGDVLLQAGPPSDGAALPTLGLGLLDEPLLDAVTRLVGLLDAPADFEFLSPLVLREVVYRLLGTDQAPRLRQIAAQGGDAAPILRAVERLRDRYAEPVAVDALARECGLSPSAFHRRFKRVTAMSPLAYQKRLQLQEARRLMVGEGLDAAEAGSRVGYGDPSQFSREYRRLFGAPPRRDSLRIRADLA